jgi:hypothetical protein
MKNNNKTSLPPHIKKIIAICLIRGYTLEQVVILCKLLTKK